MSNKLKALSLGLVAMLAMGVFGAVGATANPNGHSGGHFVSNAPGGVTNIAGSEAPGSAHNMLLSIDGGTPFDCTVSTYSGTANGATVTQITVTPNYDGCDTTPITPPHNIIITENGCKFTFTVNTAPNTTHNAVHIGGCNAATPYIQIQHPNCTMRIPPQTVTGVTYTNVMNPTNGKHELTLDSTVSNLTTHFESGICIFLGTSHTASLVGSATFQGVDAVTGEPASITATG